MEAVVFIVFFSIFYFKFDSTEDIVDEKSTAHLEGPAVNHTWCPVLSPLMVIVHLSLNGDPC